MRKVDSVVNLDPIAVNKRKQPGLIGRFFMTKHFRGKHLDKCPDFGHYLLCGPQGSSKTSSAIFLVEYYTKKYQKQKKNVVIFSNMGIGHQISKFTIHPTFVKCEYDPNTIYIFLIDEIHTYFPKDTKDKVTLLEIDKLTSDFSQLRKRQAYVFSTSQVYGRVNKNLREQCLYMVACKRSFFNKCVNDFIPGDDIMCDDLGRWSGTPKYIFVHGLPKTQFDTHKLILS